MIDKRKLPVLLILLASLIFSVSCSKNEPVTERTTSDYVYHSSVTAASEEESATGETGEEETTAPETTTGNTAVETAAGQSDYVTITVTCTAPYTTQPVTAPAQTTAAQITAAQPPVTAPAPEQTTVYSGATEVDLSINMPSANGKMKVIKTSSDKYIKKVSSEKGIDASNLCAVITVPDNGQNYVFEFSSASARSMDHLKKVYLLDSDCNIQSIASSDSSQRVNLSATENWFCMNVLIKGVIFPAIKDQF